MKEQLSSRMTFLYKFVFPVLFVLLAYDFFHERWSGFKTNERIMYTSLLVILGLLTFWFCCWLKKIYVIGDRIFISNYIREICVDRSDIADVRFFYFGKLPFVWIYFDYKTPLGRSVFFTPYYKMFTYYAHPVLNYLETWKVLKTEKKTYTIYYIIKLSILLWIVLSAILFMKVFMKQ